MNLADLETFVLVAERGSVSRAARGLRITQPAATRRIQRLEAAVGVALLDRRAKPSGVTPAGKLVLERCRSVLRAVEELRSAVTSEGSPTGEFRLGVVSSLADLALAEPADHLRRTFPRLTLRLTTAWSQTLLEQVREGVLDAAIVYLPAKAQPPADTGGRKVATIPLLFVAARSRRLPGVLDLAQMASEGWVLNPDGCGFRAALRRAFDGIGVPLRVAVEAQGMDLQLSLVARGAGLGLVPAPVLRRSRLRSRLRTFRVRRHDFRVEVWIAHGNLPAGRTPVISALSDRLFRVFSGVST
jgi:DNA-binding transcriptional LysR family regulator